MRTRLNRELKGQVIRAIFLCNLWRNIVAKLCYPYYHPRTQLVKHQDLLPKVEPSSTSCNMLLQLMQHWNLLRDKLLAGVVIRATKLCNLQSNNVARQVARKGCAYYLTLSNLDDQGNKNVTNLHTWKWNTVILHALHVHFFIFWHFTGVLLLSTTWNDLFCSCLDDVSIWWQMFNFVFLPLKRWFQFNSTIVENILQASWLRIIEKWLKKREVRCLHDVLAAVDVVFA